MTFPKDGPRIIAPFPPDASLQDALGLTAPPFGRSATPFRQLDYITDYVKKRKCQTVLIEPHYIDRDFIEDHSLFYSRSLDDRGNSCARIHFFRCSEAETRAAFQKALSGESEAATACLFGENYIGFTVIKPLDGSPVGRTVLQPYDQIPEDLPSQQRLFTGARDYSVHLGPVRLSVKGLAFQQQDVGVSACATTALWSALNKVRDFEEIGAPTPAQITTLATKYLLPFGRPIPSDEGLSLEQMCQAVQELHLAPHVLHAEDFRPGRSYLYSALRSGFAPVLLVASELEPDIRHAITAVGMRVAPRPVDKRSVPIDLAERLLAVYVHDDRVGPYLRLNLIERRGRMLLETHNRAHSLDRWYVEYLLLPLHQKIRLSLSGLREIGIRFVQDLLGAIEVEPPLHFEHWFARTQTYLQELTGTADAILIEDIWSRFKWPRYLGIVRVTGSNIGSVDLLLDSTSTMKNLNIIAIVCSGTPVPPNCSALVSRYRCQEITKSPAGSVTMTDEGNA